jgi:uncharacterized tellurite resistance protein B-like protein
MFEAFRNFVADFVEGEKHPSQFADNDYRLAAVALLVHAATIDGDMSERERDKLHAVVKSRFALTDAQADELIDKATAAEHEAVDLYHFTSLLNRVLDEEGRAKVVEMMWQIVYADGRRDELIISCGAPPISSACRRVSASSCGNGSPTPAASRARPEAGKAPPRRTWPGSWLPRRTNVCFCRQKR